MRWIDEFGWRPLDPLELNAIALFTTRFGELMGIRGLPTTYDGYLRAAARLRARALRVRPGRTSGSPRRRIADRGARPRRGAAAPLVRRVSIALMDEPLRDALGLPAQPAWLVAPYAAGCGCGRSRCGSRPRAREPYATAATTYPHGYPSPTSAPPMLDALNAQLHQGSDPP